MQSFLTAVDSSPKKNRKEDVECAKLKETVRTLVATLAPNRDFCAQAALNINLPTTLLDFDRVLRLSAIDNTSSLAFTCSQLKALYKECTRLRRSIDIDSRPAGREESRNNTRKETSIAQKQQQKENDDKLRNAIQEELAKRARIKELKNSQQIERKKELMKKRAEKAKSMNKHAFKIYKNHQLQLQKSLESFKLYTYSPSASLQLPLKPPPILHSKKDISTLKQSTIEADSNSQLLKVSIVHTSYVLPSDKCKTAAARFRIRCNQNTIDTPDHSQERFAEYRKREAQTRYKKEELQRSKEEQALYRLIKKHQKLMQINHQHKKDSEHSGRKDLQLTHADSKSKTIPPQTPVTPPPQQQPSEPDMTVQKKCQVRQMRKEAHLQDQVNRIRQELRTKEERRHQLKLKRAREHEEKTTLNQIYFQSHLQRCQTLKENDYKHEMTIRRRQQLHQQKQKDTALFTKVSKLTDQELLKSIQRLDHSHLPFTPIVSK